MKPSELSTALAILIDSKQPACIWGSPGIGKSQIVAQTACSTFRPLKQGLNRGSVAAQNVLSDTL